MTAAELQALIVILNRAALSPAEALWLQAFIERLSAQTQNAT